jgi:hypothetical protein
MPGMKARKNYTRKIKFDYEKGEQKHLLFSIDTERCQKGVYTFQVWHNGIMIGRQQKLKAELLDQSSQMIYQGL